MRKVSVCMAVLAVILSLPVLAADRVIYNGIDTWRTPGGGQSSVDFSSTPSLPGSSAQILSLSPAGSISRASLS